MSMNETLSNGSILQLPTEVVHLIFDYMNLKTIFYSIAPVCRIIREKVNSYNRLKLSLSYLRQTQVNFLAQIIQPENVISISLRVNNNKNPSNVNLFFSSYEFDQFVRLKSLKLIQINRGESEEFFNHISRYKLKSLSIVSSQTIDQIHRTIKQMSSVIDQIGLENLDLTLENETLSNESVLKSISIVLKRLQIAYCTYEQYHLILSSCVYLRTLVIERFTCRRTLETNSLTFACSTYPQLRSLMLNSFEFDQLFSLLSLTPSLVCLQLNIKRCQSVDILSGYIWKKFIEDRLSHLKIFRFVFIHQKESNCNIAALREVFNSFEDPFWFNEKHWMIICDYVLQSSEINLYTRPMSINDNQIVIRRSTLNPCYHIIERKQSFSSKQLTTLDLSRIRLSDFGVSLLSDVLKNNTMLTIFKCHGNILSQKHMSSIVEAIGINETLTTLDFQCRQKVCRDQGFGPFLRREGHVGGFFSYATGRFTMNCTTEWSHSKYSRSCFEPNGWQEFYVNNERVSNEDATLISTALMINKTLKVLHLRSSKISQHGAKDLGNALQNNRSLITLDCQDNAIGDDGVEHLANALKINSTLTTLNLAQNSIDQKGIEHLSNALKINKTLTTLDLGKNSLQSPAIQCLSNALKENQTLTTLILASNQSGSIGIRYLAEALETNTTLTTIDLQSNEIDTSGCEHLAVLLRKNQTLRTLNLQWNSIDDQGAQHLIDGLKNNQTIIALHLQNNRSIEQCHIDLLNQFIHRNEKLRQENCSLASN